MENNYLSVLHSHYHHRWWHGVACSQVINKYPVTTGFLAQSPSKHFHVLTPSWCIQQEWSRCSKTILAITAYYVYGHRRYPGVLLTGRFVSLSENGNICVMCTSFPTPKFSWCGEVWSCHSAILDHRCYLAMIPGTLLLTDISWTSIEIRALISCYIYKKQWYIIIHTYINFNGG